MNFMVRPSKSFLFDLLQSKLKSLKGEIGLDAASAHFKNYHMFKTRKYYGLDIDLVVLENGLSKHGSSNTFGIWADLSKLDKLPANSIDVIVSTHTLDHLSVDKHLVALKHLARLTAPQGTLICQFAIHKVLADSIKILKDNFKQIKIIYYKNFLSQFYEWIFERDGYLGDHPIAGTKPFRLLAWLISRLEFLTCHLPKINKQVFIVCQSKKKLNYKNSFNISHLPIIRKMIIDLIN
jgi:SAM-dependent methyltransferase